MMSSKTKGQILPFKLPENQDIEHPRSIEEVRRDWFAGMIGGALHKFYPATSWLVDIHATQEGGIAQIRCPRISTKYGMVIRLTTDQSELVARAMRAGGELLERFRVARNARKTQDDLAKVPKLINGEARHAAKGEIT
jgi:hypothetical protein